MLYDYSFKNHKRDLTDTFTTILRDEPRFISNFRHTKNAVSVRHEYDNDILPVRSFIGQSDVPGVFFIDQHAVPFVHAGTVLTADQSPVLYYVDGDPNGNMIAINVLEDNGCSVGENFEELGNDEVMFHIMDLTTSTTSRNTPASFRMLNLISSYRAICLVTVSTAVLIMWLTGRLHSHCLLLLVISIVWLFLVAGLYR